MNKTENQIFSDNLEKLLALHGKKQNEVASEIGVSTQTFNTWCRGIAVPRMEKLQRLAAYFNMTKAGLLDPLPISDSQDILFPFQVTDSSMEPRICVGDTLLIRGETEPETGDVVIVKDELQNQTICRRLRHYAEGIMLLPSNTTYDPLIFTKEDLAQGKIRILGKAVELRAKL